MSDKKGRKDATRPRVAATHAGPRTQTKIDNPDDAELHPPSETGAHAEDATDVALDNPDDGDVYEPGEEPRHTLVPPPRRRRR